MPLPCASRRAPLVLLLALAACSGGSSGGGTPPPPPDVGAADGCARFELGKTCTLELAPGGREELLVQAPGTGWTFVTITLSGSTSYTSWVLRNRLTGEVDAWCDDPTNGRDQSCLAYVVGGAWYRLQVDEREGRAGSTHVTVFATERAPDLGSAGAPVPVSTDSLLHLGVGAGGTSHVSFRAARSGSHVLAVTGPFTSLAWELFDPSYPHPIRSCSGGDTSSDLTCAVSLTEGASYRLAILEHAGAPQHFVLTVGSGAADEGSAAAPVAVPVGGPPRLSSVDTSGRSFYTFTPEASGPHAIQLDLHQLDVDGRWFSYPADLGWTLFDDAALAHPVAACRDYRGVRTTFQHCNAPLVAGRPYVLRVDEQAGFPARAFQLTVVHRAGGGGTSHGLPGAPVPLYPEPLSHFVGWGEVAANGSSYYSFRTGPAASAHRIAAASENDDLHFPGANLRWALFADPSFTVELARCARATGVAVQSCLTPVLEAASTYYLRVDEHDGIGQRVGFSVHEGFAPPTATSLAAPLAIPLGPGGLDAVQDNTLSTGWYTFTTADAGTYRITSNLATGDAFALVAWHLYDDAAFSRPVGHCFQSGPTRSNGTACTIALAAGGTYFLRVEAVGAQSGDPLSWVSGGNDLHLAVERLVP